MTESREQAGAPVQACKRVDHLARECREVASRADARLDRLFSPTRLVLPAGGRGSNRLSPHNTMDLTDGAAILRLED